MNLTSKVRTVIKGIVMRPSLSALFALAPILVISNFEVTVAQDAKESRDTIYAKSVGHAIQRQNSDMYLLVRWMTAIKRGQFKPEDKARVDLVQKKLEKRKPQITRAIAELRAGHRIPELHFNRSGTPLMVIGTVSKEANLFAEILEINGPRFMKVLLTKQDYAILNVGDSEISLEPLETRSKVAVCYIRNIPTRKLEKGQAFDLTGKTFQVVDVMNRGTQAQVVVLDAISVKDLKKEIVPQLDVDAVNPDRVIAEWVLAYPFGRATRAECVDESGKKTVVKDFLNLPAGEFKIHLLSCKFIIGDDFAALGKLTELRYLLIGAHAATDDVCKYLADAQSLETLMLTYTSVSDDGLKHLQNLENLKTLDLRQSLVTDEGLAVLKSLTQLRSLNLWKCYVTDAGLDHLSELKELQFLDVSETDVTLEGLRKFKKTHPNCTIKYKAR